MKSDDLICPILIVDDDSDLCLVLAARLRNICPVHVEHNLDNTEKYLRKEKPVIILLDNNLPDGLGIRYIRHVLDLYPDVKIVLMTADTSARLNESAIYEGAIKFIAKPFRMADINELIFSICPDLRAA
jgi:two-component system, OmpR family, response regulator